MHIVAQRVGVHAFAILIDAQAQATAHLLSFPDIAAALFQGADLEYIRVIPAFAQGRVGENEPHRRPLRITIQQQLLVAHDQVISINVVRGLLFFVGQLTVGNVPLLID